MTEMNSPVYVYYAPNEYAGFLRRLCIAIVDPCVITGLWFLLTYLVTVASQSYRVSIQVSFFSFFIIAYLYLVVVKRTIGTVGYFLVGVKIVDLSGRRPSIIRMTGRFLWLFALPASLILDLLWLTSEETRQTVRDKTVGTYVITKKAKPMGTGDLQIKVLSMLSLCLRYREVAKHSEDGT